MEEPTGELIAQWKAEYGEIFSIGGYIFRALRIGEYNEIARHRDWTSTDAEDFVVKTGILYPEFTEVESQKAGLISSLAEEVLNLSGYGEVDFARKMMDEARSHAEEVVSLMKTFIIAGMPSYTDESLDNYTFAELADKVAMAEKIIEVRQGQSTLQLIDPAEEAAKQKEELAKEMSARKNGQASSIDPIAQKLKNALG